MNTYKTYAERAARHPNACAKELFELMERKKTNLSVAADVTTKKELLAVADAVGPFVCVLKVDIYLFYLFMKQKYYLPESRIWCRMYI